MFKHKKSMNKKIEIKSLMIGLVAGGIAVLLLGASANQIPSAGFDSNRLAALLLSASTNQTNQKLTNEFAPLAFSVLAVTRQGESVDGKQNVALRLAPSHLTAKRMKGEEGDRYEEFCRQQNETREFTVVTKVDKTFEMPTNNAMIVFQAVGLYQGGGGRGISRPSATNATPATTNGAGEEFKRKIGTVINK